MSFSRCSRKDGQLVHDVFQSVVCFQGIHILHVTLSFFIIVLFITICIIITICNFESRVGRDPLAK